MKTKDVPFYDTRFYRQWENIVRRTTDPKFPAFRQYGARGIQIAEIFRKDPVAMLWELGLPPAPDLTVERISSNKGYVPGNIKWADWNVQANNRRSSVRYDYKGKEFTISELAREIGMCYFTLNKRIKRERLPIEQAISRPLRAA